MENAIKYGDGKEISISFSEEEGCILIAVKNSGCTLPDTDLPHIFESFWRGANAENLKGSGLGLYICRQLMHKMNGEVFAQIKGGDMCVTAVFGKHLAIGGFEEAVKDNVFGNSKGDAWEAYCRDKFT